MRPCTKERRRKRKIPKSVEEVEAELKVPDPDLGQGLKTELLQKAKTIEHRKLLHLFNQRYRSFILL